MGESLADCRWVHLQQKSHILMSTLFQTEWSGPRPGAAHKKGWTRLSCLPGHIVHTSYLTWTPSLSQPPTPTLSRGLLDKWTCLDHIRTYFLSSTQPAVPEDLSQKGKGWQKYTRGKSTHVFTKLRLMLIHNCFRTFTWGYKHLNV